MSAFRSIARRVATPAAVLLAAATLPTTGGAQETTTLVGIVVDSVGHAVPAVTVNVAGTSVQARTDDAGGFRMLAVPVGKATLGVRRLGFAPTFTELTLRAGFRDSVVIRLTSVAAKLEGVVVEDEATTRSKRFLAGFWERRSHGFGNFMTRQEVEARHTSDFAELVRNIPSARVQNINGRNTIRFKRYVGTRDCPPQFFVDGLRLERAEADEFNVDDVEALEVYAGVSTIPVQFAPRPSSYTCGAVIIWTRVP